MRIEEPTEQSVRYVADNIRERDLAEFMAVSSASSEQGLKDGLVARYAAGHDVFVAWLDDEPVAVGAMVQHRPNVVTLMFFATDKFNSIYMPLTRFIRQRLFPLYRNAGVHRIECVSLDGYDAVHRWIEMLGLQREGEPMRGYGRNGETFVQVAWVADDICAPGA